MSSFERKSPKPGVTRDNRIDDEGLQRLERQLKQGARMSDAVLLQWVKRYGEAARSMIRAQGRDLPEGDDDLEDRFA
jgi:hypothetical protein